MNLPSRKKKHKNKSGKNADVKEKESWSANIPPIVWIEEKEWAIYDFDEESGAVCRENLEGVYIYVNKDNKYLKSITKESRKNQSAIGLEIYLGKGLI